MIHNSVMLADIHDRHIMENKFMSKLLSSVLFATILVGNFVYAETIKSSKNTKLSDINQTMTDDEFMKKMMVFEQRQNDAKAKTEALNKLEKTVDELSSKVGIKNK